MVDKEGRIWVVVRYKNNPERVKKAFYIGDSRDIPPLPKNATEKQKASGRRCSERGNRTRVQEAARPQGHIRRPGAGGEETRDRSHLQKLALRNNRLAPPVE